MSGQAEDRRQADRTERALAFDVLELDGGYVVAWCSNPDGTTALWLVAPDEAPPGAPHTERGCACRTCAPHEDLGALPPEYRVRGFRCAAIAISTGQRCRSTVRHAGGFCGAHRREGQNR